ncbi:hypothetical protein AKJ16_DCAP05069 [Drosera capensis]
MDNVLIPVLGIAAAAAVTFYVVSFSELSEKSFRDLDEKEAAEEEEDGLSVSMTPREKRAARAAKRARKAATAQQRTEKNNKSGA